MCVLLRSFPAQTAEDIASAANRLKAQLKDAYRKLDWEEPEFGEVFLCVICGKGCCGLATPEILLQLDLSWGCPECDCPHAPGWLAFTARLKARQDGWN